MKRTKIIAFVLTFLATIFIIASNFIILTPDGITSLSFGSFNSPSTIIKLIGVVFTVLTSILLLVRIFGNNNKGLFISGIIFSIASIGFFIYFFMSTFFGETGIFTIVALIYESALARFMFILFPVLGLTFGIIGLIVTLVSNSEAKNKPKKIKKTKNNDKNTEAPAQVETPNDAPVQMPQLNINTDTANNSSTVDIADRVQRMRQDLIEGNFHNYQDTQDETVVPVLNEVELPEPVVEPVMPTPTPIQAIPEQPVQPTPTAKTPPIQPRVFKSITEEFGEIKLKNPYEEVILPRRLSGMKYEGEPVKKYSEQKLPERDTKNVQLDGSYRDKLFVGEGERIWEVFKSVERIQPNLNKPTNNSFRPTEVERSQPSKKTNTMEVNVDDINDPINENSATIDWEE